jgi:hypothetical protein
MDQGAIPVEAVQRTLARLHGAFACASCSTARTT